MALAYAEDGLCDDIMQFQWVEKFQNIAFDAIVFADVLEHLTEPERVLCEAGKLLKENGFSSVAVDTEIWKRVWSQEEKLNYHSTPMFMVSAVKAGEDVWSCDKGVTEEDPLCTAPGTKKSGFLKLGGGEFALPYTVICGSNPGKTVLITAAVHAGEHVGIQAAIELAENLKPEKINGRVIIVKTICRREFEERSGSICREDNHISNLKTII